MVNVIAVLPLLRSPSLRRVWVEMSLIPSLVRASAGHPPCGGCGLKCVDLNRQHDENKVTLLAEGVG